MALLNDCVSRVLCYVRVLIPLNVFTVMGVDLEHDLLMILHCYKKSAVIPGQGEFGK